MTWTYQEGAEGSLHHSHLGEKAGSAGLQPKKKTIKALSNKGKQERKKVILMSEGLLYGSPNILNGLPTHFNAYFNNLHSFLQLRTPQHSVHVLVLKLLVCHYVLQ